MTLDSIIDRLSDAKDLVAKVVPDAIDTVADACHQIEAAARNLSAFLKQFRAAGPVGGTPEVMARAEALRAECEAIAGGDLGRVAGLPPGLKELLATLILKLLDKLLSRGE